MVPQQIHVMGFLSLWFPRRYSGEHVAAPRPKGAPQFRFNRKISILFILLLYHSPWSVIWRFSASTCPRLVCDWKYCSPTLKILNVSFWYLNDCESRWSWVSSCYKEELDLVKSEEMNSFPTSNFWGEDYLGYYLQIGDSYLGGI